MLQRLERRFARQLAASEREAQAVAGHGIDEPGSIAGEQQPVDGRRRVDGERPEHRRARDSARVRETVAKERFGGDSIGHELARIPEHRLAGPAGRTTHTFVRASGTGATPM